MSLIETVKNFILLHPKFAPLGLTAMLVLAGFNIPISADVVILLAATLAATLLKGAFLKIYLAIYFGSLLAAYAAYFQGKYLGDLLKNKSFFKKLFPEHRLDKLRSYYAHHALATLIIGRFIPFGFRNALFISTGLSKFSFRSLAIRDAVACLIWSFTTYSTFYYLILSAEDVLSVVKKFNLAIFCVLGISAFALLWYKQIRKQKLST